jgi:hypothetical protein
MTHTYRMSMGKHVFASVRKLGWLGVAIGSFCRGRFNSPTHAAKRRFTAGKITLGFATISSWEHSDLLDRPFVNEAPELWPFETIFLCPE